MILFVIVLAVIIVAVILFSKGSTRSASGPKETRYSKTGNYMDFDPGVDSDKVGDPKYPNAGIDSVMKHEFLDDLIDKSK